MNGMTEAGPSNYGHPPRNDTAMSQPSIDLTADSDDEETISQPPNARTSTSKLGPFSSPNSASNPFSHYASSSMNGFSYPHNGNSNAQDFEVTSARVAPRPMAIPSIPYVNYNPNTGSSFPSGSTHIGVNGYPAQGTSSSPIDVTQNPPSPKKDDKKPVCIGAIMSRGIVLYPTPAIMIGTQPPPNSREKYDLVDYRGSEMLRVKLKYRAAGAKGDEPMSVVRNESIHIYTPGMTSFIGELDHLLADHLIAMMRRGLLRLEGFVVRLTPDAPVYQIPINVLLFTLPSNINYVSSTLMQSNLYLLDPIPAYDPERHTDHPRYENAHGGGDVALRMMQEYQQLQYQIRTGINGFADRDKTKQVEVQRAQMDEVFKTLESGTELDQSDPGPFIKTTLFPHQRKALTFLLQREQDYSALKRAKKNAARQLKKRKDSSDDDPDEGKEKDHREDTSRSLWEGRKDEKGRTRLWKHKITGEEIKTKKGVRPKDCKGAILADDMGLGKTLSLVSLIAATRSSSRKWASTPLQPTSPEPSDTEELAQSEIKTRVFGMPSDEASTSKKRKIDEKENQARRSRIVRRSKATLLICPMSTITNWEDQIKEHWDGDVQIVGGASGIMPPKKIEKKWRPPNAESESDSDPDFDTLKVYIYHGPARRPDPHYIADFDIVITTYSTMANEYSKQTAGEETPDETADNSADEAYGDTSINTHAVKPEVEAEIKAAEVADALRKKVKKSGKLTKPSDVQTSALQAIDWFRIVLDEAHYIKGPTTVASRASCYLEADRRIALTGTPIQNKIEDVWALFRFLRLEPLDQRETFGHYIAKPCKDGEQIGVARLQLVMKCCTLRRTKDSTTEDGKKILNLPPRKETQMWLTLREDERKVYDERAKAVKDRVGILKEKNELNTNYANILQEVLRLRQICNHVDLASMGPVEEDYDGTVMDYQVAIQGIERYGLTQPRAVSVVCFLKDGAGAQCAECTYDFGDYFPSLGLGGVEEDKKTKKMPFKAILTKCQHLYCLKCFKKAVYSTYPKSIKNVVRACGICSQNLKVDSDVIEVTPPGSTETTEIDAPRRAVRKKYVRPPGEKPNLSTKMQFLHDELMHFSRQNPNTPNYDPFGIGLEDEIQDLDADGKPFITKSVVFSQWTSMLDRIGDMLDEANILYARLDGTMTREERAKSMDELKNNKRIEVLLVSTRAGGVGLNLTTASRCYLVDPYWNPSVEAQAIDRIHRLGQTRPVTAIKLMINDSVEKRLDEIQKKKANLAQMSLKAMTRKELMEQKAEELQSLFS